MAELNGFRLAHARSDTERELITDQVRRDRVLSYLRDGAPVRPGHRTDGRWIWPEQVIDDLATRGLAPESGLYQQIAGQGFYCRPVTQAMVDAAEAAMSAGATGRAAVPPATG